MVVRYFFSSVRWVLLTLVFPQVAWSAIEASPSFPVRIDIQNFGIYKLLDKKGNGFQAEATAGYASVVSTRHIEETVRVSLKRGQVFGFNYAVTDPSIKEEWVPVTIYINHPATKNYLGKDSLGFKQKSGAHLKPDGRYHNGAFYIFSEPYEAVPGEWYIGVTYRDQVVASIKFIIE